MARRLRFSGVPGRGAGDPWFRIGTLDVNTTVLVAGVCAAMWIPIAVFYPMLHEALRFEPDAVKHGELWRLVTWPLANVPGLWSALTLVFFWYFGRMLEEHLGRAKMMKLLVTLALSLSVLALAISLVFFSPDPIMQGIDSIELIVVLLFIAEFPHVRFFFNIPGWVFGVAIVAIQALQLIALRGWLYLLLLLLGLLVGAVVARAFGLLAEYKQVPQVARGPRPRKPKAKRGQGSVVSGPWAGSSSQSSSDRAKLDALLDKIGEGGMGSLSKAEIKQLEVLRRRLRGE